MLIERGEHSSYCNYPGSFLGKHCDDEIIACYQYRNTTAQSSHDILDDDTSLATEYEVSDGRVRQG